MPYILQGRVCLVTGGSRGIGAETVRKFAAEGCNVAINYLNGQIESIQLAEDMQNQYGVKTAVIQGDMAKVSDCHNLVRNTIDELGGLDVIVSNAGNTKFATFSDIYALSPEDWDDAWHLLVMANLFLLQEARPTFESNPDGGCLLIMSSVGGLINNGSSMAYSITRAAGLALNRCLASTQGPKVRVNAVCPGFVPTERTASNMSDSTMQSFSDMAALKQLTTVEDVADAFVFLAKNGSMTGERIRVDSGMFVGQ